MKLFALMLTLSAAAWGQTVSGNIVGVITDATGAVVPNAKVTLVEVHTNITRTAASNQSGNYSFTNLDPGNYRLEVEVPGFRKATRSGMEVLMNSTVRADIELQPGQLNEVVSVTAEASVLQTDRADTGRKIETKLLADMPLAYNRNFQSLVNLVPGAARAFRPHSEFFNVQDSLASRVNGQSRLANNVQVEGTDDNHRTGLLTAMIPPLEAIQAVDITTSNYEAELGRAGGAVINVNFKSGTNNLHGSVFEFNKVSRLGARNFFATTKPVTTQNVFGFTLGGPIRKSKLFYFVDYQGIRDRRGDVHRGTIPTMAFRQGNLNWSRGTDIYDPATGDENGLGRQPFPNRTVPAGRTSPIARRILDLIPPPTNDAENTNFEISTVRKKDANMGDIKLDYQITDHDRVSVRWSRQSFEIFDPPLYGVKAGGFRDFAGTGIQNTHNGALVYTRVFSPTLISELRAGIMYYRNNASNADRNLRTAEELGIPGVNVSDFTGGIPAIVINGFSNPVVGYSPSLPWERGETNLNFADTWTKISGNHTIKFGFDYRRNRDELLQNQTFNPRGRFNFREGTTQLLVRNASGQLAAASTTSFANSFASFLLDLPNEMGRDLPIIFPTFLQRPFFSFVQDTWVLSPKITLNLGLRHELYPPAVPRVKGGFSNYNPFSDTLEVAGYGSIPMNLGRKNYLNSFAPRFGVAYRANDKTVFRGGYGISWVPLVDNGYAFNFPVRENNSFQAPNAFQPAGSMRQGFPPFRAFAIPENGIIHNPPEQVYNYIPKDVRESYIQSYNVAIQRTLPGNFVAEAAYVGNHGVGVKNTYNLNAGFVIGAGQAGRPLFRQFGRNSNINNIYFGTSTTYNSLQAKFDRRFSNGFMMTTAYTWSKAIDWGGADNGGFWTYILPRRSRARADGDRSHVFVQSYIYELPLGAGKRWLHSGLAAALLGGWQVNGILTFQTGEPFTPSVPASILNAPGNPNTPNLVGQYRLTKGVGNHTTWFDPSAFQQPAPNTIGNLGRNVLTGPGLANLDLSAFKRFAFTERYNLEFRFESFNFTNTPKFNNPSGDITSPNFGRVTSAQGPPNGPREIQLGLKLVF
jgi:hypothetical protein